MVHTSEPSIAAVGNPTPRRVAVALVCAAASLSALVGLLSVTPREADTVAKTADAVLMAVPIVGLGLALSWRRPMWAWLFASAIAPSYLLLAVLFRLDHFGGWFDFAFVVICLWGVLLAGVGALVGRIVVKRRFHGDT